ncbi:RlmE family RNA methyltransferase [Magnetospira sp. QH-2]|uniref:RlmE family RNA methyltransferase n=1 Tax=Magnetospira sp. (strain QH-2) TaxID=1288970 RepID=UPI0003E812A1|nr:RlmE family RNA methyltransferase [Magnetospira sp. QH-2]CCQ74380.1 Ribosomal RNA large subunit (23S) methyltransferase [Magnetospira sp. QH-2]
MTTKSSGKKNGGKGSGGLSGRNKSVRVRTAKGRKISSTRWLQRQLNDPYVAEARKLGYRSRAAFKLLELDEKYNLIKPGMRVVDLGAAPGGWTQVIQAKIKGKGQVVALDIQEMDDMPGATVLHLDFMDDRAPERLKQALDGPADLVVSDMAAPVTGHAPTDHLRIMGLVEAAVDFAGEVLAPGGTFVAKVFQGGTEAQLLAHIKLMFRTVRHAKPPSSRADSSEIYLVATGFRAEKPTD